MPRGGTSAAISLCGHLVGVRSPRHIASGASGAAAPGGEAEQGGRGGSGAASCYFWLPEVPGRSLPLRASRSPRGKISLLSEIHEVNTRLFPKHRAGDQHRDPPEELIPCRFAVCTAAAIPTEQARRAGAAVINVSLL